MSEVSSEAVEAWEKYRDGELCHRNRRQLRKRDFLAGYLAAHQPARVVPSVEEVRDELSGWPIGSGYYATQVGTDEARDMAEAVLALFAAQPTVQQVREPVAAEIEAQIKILRLVEQNEPAKDFTSGLARAARVARGEKGGA